MKTVITITISLAVGLAIGWYLHQPLKVEYTQPVSNPNAVTIPGFDVQY